MTKEQLRQRFLDLGDNSEIKNVEDVYNEFLDCLALPIDVISDLSDLECYDYTLEYEYYNLWIYTDKSEYQMCFSLTKESTYGCDMCGERKKFEEEIIWITSSYGVCKKCYQSLNEEELEILRKEYE